MPHDDVKFDDYVKDTQELADTASAIISDLRRQLREREILMWAMVRASGGTILVRNMDLALGMPDGWRIEEDAATNGRRFTIETRTT